MTQTSLEHRRSLRGKLLNIYGQMKNSSKIRKHKLPSFSFEELEVFAYKNNYEELHLAWKQANYNTLLAPSFDRLRDEESYNLNNLRLGTWKQNKDNYYSNPHGKNLSKVAQLDMFGKTLFVYKSIVEAANKLQLKASNIQKALSRAGTTGGYKWQYTT